VYLIPVHVIRVEIANACVLLLVLMLRNAIDMESISTGETSSFVLSSVMAVDLMIHVLVLVQSLVTITIIGRRLKPHALILASKAVLATMSTLCLMTENTVFPSMSASVWRSTALFMDTVRRSMKCQTTAVHVSVWKVMLSALACLVEAPGLLQQSQLSAHQMFITKEWKQSLSRQRQLMSAQRERNKNVLSPVTWFVMLGDQYLCSVFMILTHVWISAKMISQCNAHQDTS